MSVHKIAPRHLPVNNQSSGLVDQRVREASELYEKQFLAEMVRAMRKTVSHGRFTEPSMAEQIYRDQLDENYVDEWTKSGGVGLADLVYQQITERYGERPVPPPSGPLPIEKGTTPLPIPSGPTMKEIKVDENGRVGALLPATPNQAVTAPWDARVERSVTEENGRRTVWLEHEDVGLRSVISFIGSLKPSSRWQAGEVIGHNQGDVVSWQVAPLNLAKG